LGKAVSKKAFSNFVGDFHLCTMSAPSKRAIHAAEAAQRSAVQVATYAFAIFALLTDLLREKEDAQCVETN
jgi:hypothetical protein